MRQIAEPEWTPGGRDLLAMVALLTACASLFPVFNVSPPLEIVVYATLGGVVGLLWEYGYRVLGVGRRLDFDDASVTTVTVVIVSSIAVGTAAQSLWGHEWLEIAFLAVWFALATEDHWRGAILYTAFFRSIWHLVDGFFPVWIELGFMFGGGVGALFVGVVLYHSGNRAGGQTQTPRAG